MSFRPWPTGPGWTVAEAGATFVADTTRWRAIVRKPVVATTGYARFHVAIIDPNGTARYVQIASTVVEARRVAEGQVRGKPE